MALKLYYFVLYFVLAVYIYLINSNIINIEHNSATVSLRFILILLLDTKMSVNILSLQRGLPRGDHVRAVSTHPVCGWAGYSNSTMSDRAGGTKKRCHVITRVRMSMKNHLTGEFMSIRIYVNRTRYTEKSLKKCMLMRRD